MIEIFVDLIMILSCLFVIFLFLTAPRVIKDINLFLTLMVIPTLVIYNVLFGCTYVQEMMDSFCMIYVYANLNADTRGMNIFLKTMTTFVFMYGLYFGYMTYKMNH